MELQPAVQAVSRRKRKIRLLFGLFIGLLFGFTLFSNTFLALTLPKVVYITPGRGELSHTFLGSGIVKWRVEGELTANVGGKIKEVLVKEGELVKKGQELVIYDRKAAEHQLLDEQAGLSKLKLTMEGLQKSYIEAAQSGDEKSIDEAKHALKVNEIDLDVQQRRIQNLQEELVASRALLAPFDGTIVKVNAVKGLDSSGAGPEVIIANGSLGFEFEFIAPDDAVAHLEIGTKLKIQLSGSSSRQVEGRIEEIQDLNPHSEQGEGEGVTTSAIMKRLLVVIQDDALQGGERAEVQLTRTTNDVILVPDKAIHEEGDETYVLGFEERKGPLGNAFYVRKMYVTIVDSNENESAVTEGLFEQEHVILESSEPLQEGDQIRIH